MPETESTPQEDQPLLPEEEDGVEDDGRTQDAVESAPEPGLDGGSGNPNEDRAYLMDQPPAQATTDEADGENL